MNTRIVRLLIVFVSMMLLVGSSPLTTFAQTVTPSPSPTSQDQMVLPQQESPRVEQSPIFLSGESLVLDQVYTGPVFAFGGQVEMTGEVYGDLVVAGGSVFIDGKVYQDVYVGGGTVHIRGEVLGNVIAAGGEVRFDPTSNIANSAIVGAENVVFSGTVLNRVYVGSRRTQFTGTVQNDVHVLSEAVSVQDEAFIGGMMTGQTTSEVEVTGSAEVTQGVAVEIQEKTPRQTRDSFYWWLSKTAVTIVSFAIILFLFASLFGEGFIQLSLRTIEN